MIYINCPSSSFLIFEVITFPGSAPLELNLHSWFSNYVSKNVLTSPRLLFRLSPTFLNKTGSLWQWSSFKSFASILRWRLIPQAETQCWHILMLLGVRLIKAVLLYATGVSTCTIQFLCKREQLNEVTKWEFPSRQHVLVWRKSLPIVGYKRQG
jgi:hypothetical protein